MLEYIHVAAGTPHIHLADCEYNSQQIIQTLKKAYGKGVKVLVLPELCIAGYTCGDLFLQSTLLEGALSGLEKIVDASSGCEMLCVVGLPFLFKQKLYNVAAVVFNGKLLALVPKSYIPNYNEFYELRHFTPAFSKIENVQFNGVEVPFGTSVIFACNNMPSFKMAVEICEDLWAVNPPSVSHVQAGATIIVNISASNETIGKAQYRRSLVMGQSARLICGYVYSSAGHGESTTDMVFAGHNIICENGSVICESLPFAEGWAESDIDLHALRYDRMKINNFLQNDENYTIISFDIKTDLSSSPLTRRVDNRPFVPTEPEEQHRRCADVVDMQSFGLMQRLKYTNIDNVVVGLSGGLDSCLAILSIVESFKRLGLPTSNVKAISMPCFGTSARTMNNAQTLSEALKTYFEVIDITEIVKMHLRDIKHPQQITNIVYENAQARMRTLVLMDLANKYNALVIGTGNLSELALGWATYCGDHMSMYGINSGVPKTLVRHVVNYYASTCDNDILSQVLGDILSTPVSPELLPSLSGTDMSQKTEEIIGAYELHDFFLYHCLRWGRGPGAIFRLALYSFDNAYSKEEILKWLKEFYQRFFANQFKRSCLPDGPKIGSVSLSPRGDWRMPSDAYQRLWLKELEDLHEV